MCRWLFGCLLVLSSALYAITPDEALTQLLNGNERFSEGMQEHPNQGQERRAETATGQEPFAVILSCSDSRVPPEIIFDQGIGDLFVVRSAGNVAATIELESIEFAIENLHSCLIFVLGHESCGAVNAVLQHRTTPELSDLAELIEPAIKKSTGLPGDPLTNAIQTNVLLVIEQLKKNQILSEYLAKNQIKIVGGYYHLADGKVTLLP